MKKQFKILTAISLVIAFTNCQAKKEVTNNKRQKTSKLFASMDTNNDGKISKYEAKGELKKNFKQSDRNNDGFITKNEMNR
ncbi:EF-hand domain-containing protein [Cellulophaga baltica]|uniref:EF-hand domain-containing protein n=1 Tax=Cellulophaga TaxID=104264 RepID=UPI001C07039F|nr:MULTISPECIES: EF-hand domain-containing protein [Cellulophaga]MBU2997108.1 EF-hand domain-containing protein [Cellulophaga baltica]MDO6768506.1 EF-hand domain-containing protein [Cellulophaga sp. 1_MG-2023]